LITALLPLLIAETETGAELLNGEGIPAAFAVNFRYITLPLLLFMALLLTGVGIFFFYNYRLLSLLEREDWPALAYYLEQKIYIKGKFSNKNVRLLASSYLVISDYNSVLKLEGKAILAKPSVIEKNALVFGAARVLSGNHADAVSFFKTYMNKGKKAALKKNEVQWLRWFYSFSQLLSGAFKLAQPEFASLAVTSRDVVISGLSAYFLNNSISKYSEDPVQCLAAAENGRQRVVNSLKNIESWDKEINQMSGDIHIAIIRKYINEAGKWIFN